MKTVFSQSLENHSTLSFFFTESKAHYFSRNYLNFSEIISSCLEIRVYFLYKMIMPEIGLRKSAFISLGKSLLIFRNRQNMGENLTQLHRHEFLMKSTRVFSYGSVHVNYRLVWRKHDVIADSAHSARDEVLQTL